MTCNPNPSPNPTTPAICCKYAIQTVVGSRVRPSPNMFLRLVILVVVLCRWPRELLSRSFFLLLCVRRRLCSSLSWAWWRPGWRTTNGWSSPRKVTPTQLACWGLGLQSTWFTVLLHLSRVWPSALGQLNCRSSLPCFLSHFRTEPRSEPLRLNMDPPPTQSLSVF